MKKKFKTESKKLMDLMINSIYTNKEIFLREIISNASDAIDKLHYMSLTDKSIKVNKKDFEIFLTINKENRTLTISDNGIGMDNDELENNLGTIAKSGSEEFKSDNEHKKNIDIIGQFGVGFYSAFMVAEKVEVLSRKYGSEEAYLWESTGVDGYTITKAEKEGYGTDIILTIKPDTEEEDYSKYLETYEIETLVRKYSDYITYPIKMEVSHTHLKEKKNENDKDEYETVTEVEVINSLTPIWRRDKKKVSDEDYDTFYSDKFNDYEKPLRHIHVKAEGTFEYNALLYIPSHAPYDFYTKDYEKGLQLYSNGVLIMEKCSDLLPDYFSFMKGVVDSPDLTLNISRETLQQNRILKTIANSIESKIKKELETMLEENKEDYEKFFKDFGLQLKYGIYNDFGMNKDKLQDLLIYHSSFEDKTTTLKDYVSRMKTDQKSIYYACGETVDKIKMLPQVSAATEKGYEVLYCTDPVDEFVFMTLRNYMEKDFINVCGEKMDLDTEEEKEELKKANEEAKDIFDIMKESVPEVSEIRFTNKLKDHPVCLSSKGDISVEMEKALSSMPINNGIKANKVLEINQNHEIAKTLKKLSKKDKKELEDYAKVLYAQARMIEGLPVENPTEIASLVCKYMVK
ncbi:TPA: molecular chaperone HtpG [Candidatus Ventrenecus stercoripullorum]|nr:molecular chaperone HtpG [Candidatus Ventrenecus stercoripullorum]